MSESGESDRFTDAAWAATAELRKEIETQPFVVGLGDGSLAGDRFTYYLAQDAHYLLDYSRALAGAAAKADHPDDIVFFAGSAQTAITVERQMHEAHVHDISAYRPSPTCVGYTSYLLGLAQTRDYPELVAGLLPCFWIYAHVGVRLLDLAGDLDGHPYGEWIGTYAAESFAESVARARAIADRLADGARPDTVDRMHTAFATASTWEWMFWDAAWRKETWPVG